LKHPSAPFFVSVRLKVKRNHASEESLRQMFLQVIKVFLEMKNEMDYPSPYYMWEGKE